MLSKKSSVIITAAITFAVTLAISVPGTKYVTSQVKRDDVLLEARDMIVENYVDTLSEEEINKMNDYAIAAMVTSLEDPYSYYLNADDLNTFEEDNQEEYVGVGVTVNFDAEKNQMVVISPTDGSPAQKAGILPGDAIVRVDDLAVSKENYENVIDHIRGNGAKAGSVVKIYVLRDGEEKEMEVVRDVIPVETVSYKMLNNDIGYVRISEFKHNSVEDFANALTEITDKNAKGLIIDLRSNPGGYADSVLKMTDMLLPKGTIAYLENNKGEKEYFNSNANHLGLPMAILVNEGTASAAELMAGSTQAYELATIVGKKTYGKAVGQTPLPLTKDTAIYLTTARYYTPKGECIDKLGIEPDIEVEMPEELMANFTKLEPAQDPQLQAAMDDVAKKIQ